MAEESEILLDMEDAIDMWGGLFSKSNVLKLVDYIHLYISAHCVATGWKRVRFISKTGYNRILSSYR